MIFIPSIKMCYEFKVIVVWLLLCSAVTIINCGPVLSVTSVEINKTRADVIPKVDSAKPVAKRRYTIEIVTTKSPKNGIKLLNNLDTHFNETIQSFNNTITTDTFSLSTQKLNQAPTAQNQPKTHTTTAQNHIDQTQIDSSLIKSPTEDPEDIQPVHLIKANRSENGRQQSDLLKQINMQIILSSNDQQNENGNNKIASTTTTTTPLPTTTTVLATTSAAAAVRPQIVYGEPGESFFGEISDVFEDMFARQSEEDDEDDESSEEEIAQPTKTVTEIYHFYDATTEPSQRTTRFINDQSPNIIYAMPPPYGGYPAYAYHDPNQIQTVYRTKRTTLQPGGYQFQGAPSNVLVGPQQVVTTNADGTKKKNYMSTQIHVTSEYNPGPTMSLDETAMALKKKGVKFQESSEEEYSFFDAGGMSGLSFDGDESEEDEEEIDINRVKEGVVDSTDEEYEEEDDGDDLDDINDEFEVAVGEDYSASVHRKKKIRRKQPNHMDYGEYTPENQETSPVKRRRRIKNKHTIAEYSDDDDSYEDRNSGLAVQEEESAPGFFASVFGDFFAPLSWMWPSTAWSPLRMFSSSQDDEVKRQDTQTGTTPRNEFRHPKRPSSGDSVIFSDLSSNDLEEGVQGEDGPWLNPFADESETGTTPMSVQTTTERDSGFWGWFGGGEDDADPTEIDSTETTTVESGLGWNLFGMFQAPTTTTQVPLKATKKPFLSVSNPLHNPQAWMGILAQHLATTTPTNITPSANQKTTYTNYQLWRLHPHTEDDLSFLADYRDSAEGSSLQWWRGPTLRGPTDIAVPPELLEDLKESLSFEDIAYDVVIWDLAKAIQYGNPQMTQREKVELISVQGHPLSWYRYHRYSDISRFLEYMQRKHPKIVDLIHLGRSFEGRPMTIIKISADENTYPQWKSYAKKRRRQQRSAVFVEAGSHAREWIGPATATWMINRLINHIHGNDSLGETIRSVDWYIMPVLNPDGYEFSHLYDRFWRKTRSKHTDGNGSMFSIAMKWIRKNPTADKVQCYGTDPNRNWAHLWSQKGASSAECSEFYAGPKPFSEPETRAVSSFLKDNQKQIKLFVSLHSYGQLVSYPGKANASYSSIRPADELHDMAQVAIESLRATGSSTRYSLDSANEMLFSRTGSADAFAMYDAGIKYAYTLELRDTGTHGFLLPASNIESSAREAFEIVRGMVDYI